MNKTALKLLRISVYRFYSIDKTSKRRGKIIGNFIVDKLKIRNKKSLSF